MLNYNRIFIALIISSVIITPLWIADHLMYSNVTRNNIPITVIIVSIISILHNKSRNVFTYILSLVIISLAVYIVLPTYTTNEAQAIIKRDLPGVVIEKVENTPMEMDGLNPFLARWFYTYELTELDGKEYSIIFNPNSGKFFEKK